ncbi:MAG TPA: hypothetical protein VGZ72_00300 [Stellaceae bacterium]|nr:hypothetical protein [Stellaceae bacterium]
MAQSATQQGGAEDRVAILGSHFDILIDRPLAELSTAYANAYVAVDRELPTSNVFALVCNPQVPPRLQVLEALHGLRLEGVLTPLEWAVIDWPLMGRRCFAIVYDRPLGGPVMQGYGGMGEPALVTPIDRPRGALGDSDLIHDVLPPLVTSLQQFLTVGATHRAVRATNVFYRDLSRRQAALGDCCAAPAGLLQPLVYETIEGGLANPWGRGEGTPSDDLYALGVTMVCLSLGRNPVADVPDEQLIADKINRGSYAAIVRNERLSPTIIEPVRGLLSDDAKERWTIQDVGLWLHGRHSSPKQPSLAKRATRPFEFEGEAHLTARSLADAFIRKPGAAARVVKSEELEAWVQRSLGEPERLKLLASAISEGHDTQGAENEERQVARVSMALDPAAPVRFKGFAAAIDGFGAALAGAFRGQGSPALVAETVLSRLPVFWFSTQTGLRPEQVPILKTFERLRLHLEDQRLNGGAERALYEMNPSLHCLWPLIESRYIVEPVDALGAIEAELERRPSEELQIDRHFAGFIAARFKLAANEWFDALSSAEPSVRALGALKLLAKLQAARGPRGARQTALRLSRQLPPAFQAIHNRARRQQLLEQLPAVAETGSLVDMLALVDSPVERQRDAFGFSAAAREYYGIQRALEGLRADGQTRPQRAAHLGASIAAATALLLAWATGLTLVVVMS